MKRRRIFWFLLLMIFIAIQFIRPARNKPWQTNSQSFGQLLHPPQAINTMLQAACSNCHSNHTIYPWYAAIQPLGWWLQYHIVAGKRQLNFDEFGNYSARRRLSKLTLMGEQLEAGKMPLPSYTWLHPAARLSGANRAMLVNWLNATRDSLSLQK